MKRLLSFILALSMIITAAVFADFSVLAYDETVTAGDMNGDGTINLIDLLLLRKKLAKYDVQTVDGAEDLNFDGKFSTADVLFMRRYLVGLISAERFERVTTAKTSDFENTVNVTAVTDKLKQIGRYSVRTDYISYAYAGAGFEFTVDVTENGGVGATFDLKSAIGQICVTIDGDYDNSKSYKINSTGEWTVVLAQNLSKGKHTIRLQKMTDQSYNRLDVKSISFDGTLGDRPADKELKLEFYGDSITCGVGSLYVPGESSNPSNYYMDGTKTYASYAAQQLGAEYSICAEPGYGWQMSYDANSNHVIKNIWDDALPNENVKWDFSYDADIVVFALNTNDNNYCRNNNKTLTVESIKAAVNEMITNVRTHNPDCQIILIGSFSSKMNSKLYNADEAMTEIAENDDSIYYIDVLPSGTSGVGYHPTVAEHLKGGTYLAEFIKTNLLK